MARKKISEFRAKTILYETLDLPYTGVSIGPDTNIDEALKALDTSKAYVVKVDQGVKKRGKQGLVKVNIKIEDLRLKIEELSKKGYQYFIIEEFVSHDSSDEQYLALSRTRDGIEAFYSEKGGIDIEENVESIKHATITSNDVGKLPKEILKQVQNDTLTKLIEAFEKNNFSFLELNPFLVHGSQFTVLDSAVEVDSAAEFFVDGKWTSSDFREFSKQEKTSQERAIQELSEKSQASFSLTMLNPNGSIFMLLSGGGASIVLADEAYNQGKGAEVANYGEYSGNPNGEETYIYTKNLLGLLLASKAPKKVLLIGGGVANFTDIRITFKGVIQALEEVAEDLRNQGVKVYVRRGGPRQKEGLAMMEEFLQKEKLFGAVHGPELVLTEVMNEALGQLEITKVLV